jgi:exonuclease SbcC
MRIDSIVLKNFISHSESKIEFKGSINVIIGQNGAGKSSIIDGIVFSLFRENLRGGKIEDLIKRGKKEAQIDLKLLEGNREIIIRRFIPNSSNDFLIEGGSYVRGALEVNKHIREIIKIPKEVLLSTIIVPQGKIEEVFDELPEIMKKLLRLDNIQKLIDTYGPIHQLIKEINNKLEQINKIKLQYENEKKLLKYDLDKLKEIEDNILKLEISKQKLLKNIELLNQELINLENEYQKYLELKINYNNIFKQLKEIENEIKELSFKTSDMEVLELEVQDIDKYKELYNKVKEKNLKKRLLDDKLINLNKLINQINLYRIKIKIKKEKEKNYNKYIEIKERIKEKEVYYNNYITKRRIYEQYLVEYEEKKNTLNKISFSEEEFEKLVNQRDQIRIELQNLSHQIGEKEGKLKELERIIQNLKDVRENKCPVCGRELSSEIRSHILKEYEEESNRLKVELLNLKNIYNKLENDLINTEKILQNSNRNKNLKENLINYLKDLELKITSLIRELQDLEKDYQEYIVFRRELQDLEKDYQEYISLLEYTEEGLLKLEEEKYKLEEEIKIIKEEIEKENINIDENELKYKLKILEEKKKILEEKKILKMKLISKIKDKESLEKMLNNITEEMIKLNFNEDNYKNKKLNYEKLKEELMKLNGDLNRFYGQKETLLLSIKDRERRIREFEVQISEEQKLYRAIEKLKRVREALSEKRLQAYLISASKNILENNLNEIITKFDLSFTSVEINPLNKYEITVLTNTGNRISSKLLSGGEKIALAIGLRLSIAKAILSDIGFLILDEPTVHLDEYRKQELLNVIRNSTSIVPQIIVVSHDQELISVGDYIIKVEKRNDNSIIKVEENDKESL